MISACHDSSSILHMTDSEFEDAWTLRVILSTIRFIEEQDPSSCGSVLPFRFKKINVSFALKYDMKQVIAAIKLSMYEDIAQYPPKGGKYFLNAALLGEWNLCGRLIGTLEPSVNLDYMWIRQRLDWRYWTLDIMHEIGQVGSKFVWAVCEAGTKQIVYGKASEISCPELGEDIARLMMT